MARNSETFNCPACGHGYFVVVSIKRQDKPDYQTEFIACSKCRVMIWSPGTEPRNKTHAPAQSTWGMMPPSHYLKK